MWNAMLRWARETTYRYMSQSKNKEGSAWTRRELFTGHVPRNLIRCPTSPSLSLVLPTVPARASENVIQNQLGNYSAGEERVGGKFNPICINISASVLLNIPSVYEHETLYTSNLLSPWHQIQRLLYGWLRQRQQAIQIGFVYRPRVA